MNQFYTDSFLFFLHMNVPNKLTLSRLILTPVAFFLFILSSRNHYLITNITVKAIFSVLVLLIMIYMELSDLIDGKIARRYHLVTDLGKVFDPFSDMFMHLSMFFAFVTSSYMSFVVFIICLWRELIMLLMRNLLASRNVSFPANIFGKSKTMLFAIITFLTLIYNILLDFVKVNTTLVTFGKVIYWIGFLAAFASLMSLIIYLYNIRKSHILNSITK